MSTRESIAYDVREDQEFEYALEQFALAATVAAEHVCLSRPGVQWYMHDVVRCPVYARIWNALYATMRDGKVSKHHAWRFIKKWAE